MTNRLRELRLKAGMTQVELGRMARIAPQNLSSIERGRLVAWEKARRRLARALRVDVRELFPTDGG